MILEKADKQPEKAFSSYFSVKSICMILRLVGLHLASH